MNHTIVDTRNKIKQEKCRSAALIVDVKKAIQMALDESKWSGVKRKNKPMILLNGNKKLEGFSGLRWTLDIVVTDDERSDEPYAAIMCIDLNVLSAAEIENALTKTATIFQDLSFRKAMVLVVVGIDKWGKKDNKSILPLGYDRLLASINVEIIEWNPKTALDFAVKLLHEIKARHRASKSHINSIKDTVEALTSKYPERFVLRGRVHGSTRCIELLSQIKENDPEFRLGEIINSALSQFVGCKSLIGTYLDSVEDKQFENLLQMYLEGQK